jgi:D-alanyl-D-alanine carboxypeptidase (penicillin-binding protein 5/6)
MQSPSYKVIAGLALLLGVLVVTSFFSTLTKRESAELASQNDTTAAASDAFADISLDARAAYVWDVQQQRVLFTYNAQAQLPLASLAKVMTALVTAELLPDSEIVRIDPDALWEEGDSGLFAQERWYAKDLRDFTLLMSSNDGASALALAAAAQATAPAAPIDGRSFIIRKMNERAKELGMTQTYFVNETGLDPTNYVSGGYGSAQDVATLMSFVVENNPSLMDATRFSSSEFASLDNFTHIATNTNEIISAIPGLLGSKTGYTELAGGNLAVAFDAGVGHQIVVIVLGSSRDGRFQDMEKLVDATLRAQLE